MNPTPRLSLPLIVAQQAQKHITHNEAIEQLDALVQPSVTTSGLTFPPANPAEGEMHVVGAGATGAWTGQDHSLAYWVGGVWQYHGPVEGWTVFDRQASRMLVFSGGTWTVLADEGGANLAQFGINASADTANRLVLSSSASLFTHEGNGHQFKINKAGPADNGSILFQSGWSGRAEFGLTGDDDWHVKVSADGANWNEALVVDAASGAVHLPTGQLRFPATQIPSPDPHTLDGYEEGTFTPRLTFGGADSGMVYVNQAGSYTKIGRAGFFSLIVQTSAKGTATGPAAIADMPFTMDGNHPGVITTSFYGGLSGIGGQLIGTTNGTNIDLRQASATNTPLLTDANFGATSTFRLSGSFQT